MRRGIFALLWLAPALAAQSLEQPLSLRAFMTRAVPAEVAGRVPSDTCSPAPTPVAAFLSTDKEAWLYFVVRNAAEGAVARSEWWDPTGRLLSGPPGGEWRKVDSEGDWCFAERLPIAGNSNALPGTWTVKVFIGNAQVFELKFTIIVPGGKTPGCDYVIQPPTQTFPGGSGAAVVAVTVSPGCTWVAESNASWIIIESGASGNGPGAVFYRVAVNTTPATRTGTLSIAGQTHTVTQQPGGAACPVTLSPAQVTISGAGGTASITVGAETWCAWSVATNAGWITITSSASGVGPGTISFLAPANPGAAERRGAISVGDKTVTVIQAGQTPVITPGGVVNAASNAPGKIARGSFVAIYGANLGPSEPWQATSYPIPEMASGVEVRLSQGAWRKNAYLHFVSAARINAILPSDTPLGEVEMTVVYNGRPSAAEKISVADTSFGVFTVASSAGQGVIQNYVSPAEAPLNSATQPATPGQIEILWGTGLGPITTPDNVPPPGGDLPVAVEVLVGGRQAEVLYKGRAPGVAGVDNIYFRLPADAPIGCDVPVQVQAAGQPSNVVRMAVSRPGGRCQD